MMSRAKRASLQDWRASARQQEAIIGDVATMRARRGRPRSTAANQDIAMVWMRTTTVSPASLIAVSSAEAI